MTGSLDPQAAVTAALERAPMTQAELGRRLGLPRASICDRVKGRARWQLADVVALADMLGVGIDDLLGRHS